MSVHLKKVSNQTIVITGATSGIGLATARMAAARGANLVLTARNDEALNALTAELEQNGRKAVSVAADVADEDALRAVSRLAVEAYGGFDTWINNAGVSVYGRIAEVTVEDHRRVFETNFWGVVLGSRIAAEHLAERGGALINIGSALSDRAIPLQGMYSASKHAVKGFTDAFRMELEAEGAPISITLIKPAAIDTPYTRHAKNYLESQPKNPAPVYAPDVVARAILHAAAHPIRDLFAGGGAAAISAAGHYAPRVTDRLMSRVMIKSQKSDRPARARNAHALDKPGAGMDERGDYEGHVSETSLYTEAKLHPVLLGATLIAAGVAAAALARAIVGHDEADRTTIERARSAVRTAAGWARDHRDRIPFLSK